MRNLEIFQALRIMPACRLSLQHGPYSSVPKEKREFALLIPELDYE